jgi:hypothetical protein
MHNPGFPMLYQAVQMVVDPSWAKLRLCRSPRAWLGVRHRRGPQSLAESLIWLAVRKRNLQKTMHTGSVPTPQELPPTSRQRCCREEVRPLRSQLNP